MASSVYSQRFASGQYEGGEDQVLATVPAGAMWIIRDIQLFNAGGQTVDQPQIYVKGAAAQTPLLMAPELAAQTQLGWQGRQIALAGETITAHFATGSTLWAGICGYEFSAV